METKKKRRRRPSVFTPFDAEIIRLLEEERTVKEIYRILFPVPDSGYSYMGLLSHINACGLRYVTHNDGYEVAPKCAECTQYMTIKRYDRNNSDFRACACEKKEVSRYVKDSPSWCPKRDHKRQGEL